MLFKSDPEEFGVYLVSSVLSVDKVPSVTELFSIML